MFGLRGDSGTLGTRSGLGFPDPFDDVASRTVPSNHHSLLYWCEHVWSRNGTYRMAMERILAYFLTEIEILNASDDESEKWRELFNNVLDAIGSVQKGLRDRMCYGSAFLSVLVPFKRFLSCPKCKRHRVVLDRAMNHPLYDWEWSIPDFIATCPSCKYRGPWEVKDETDNEEKTIKIKNWSPHEIELIHEHYSGRTDYVWRINEEYKHNIRRGFQINLEEAPMSVIDAIAKNQQYKFNKDAIFHMKEHCLSGINNRGWGIPRLLNNWGQVYYVQVLRRQNEAIGLDYVTPFRIITPAARPGSSATGGFSTDPLMSYNGGDFRAQARAMIRQRRYDPASISVFPFPVNFQMFGADANQLAPRDLLDQGQETLLNEIGTPVELYNGSLQLQTVPTALRLFESTWHHLVHDANFCLMWLTKQIGQILSWEVVEARLKRVVIADDLERHMMAAQMMMSQQLSATTVLRDFGYDYRQEQKQLADESKFMAELQSRNDEEMQQAGFAQQIAKGQSPAPGQPQPQGQGGPPAQGGGGGGGGQQAMQPSPGPVSQYLATTGPSVPQSPEDMLAVADSLATELVTMPESAKDAELRKLKTANPLLHSTVKDMMQEKRKGMKQQMGAAPAA